MFRGSTARKLAHFSRKITLTTPYVNVAFNRGGFVPRHLSTKLAKYIRFSCPDAKLFQFSVKLRIRWDRTPSFFFSFFFISSLELTRRRRSVRFAAHLLLKLISIHHCPGHKGSDRGINPLRSKNIFLEGQPVIKIRNSLSYCIDLMLEDKIVTIIKSMK